MINVVGGVYREIVKSPEWDEVYGSGGRAALAISKLGGEVLLTAYCGPSCAESIKANSYHEGFGIDIREIQHDMVFQYLHPLSTPSVNSISLDLEPLEVKAENILCFGMIESSFVVHGDKVVYDPQSTISPVKFSSTGSTAKKLAIVLNHEEALSITQRKRGDVSIEELSTLLSIEEDAAVVVIKDGPHGAVVYDRESYNFVNVYESKSVWKIGSGDAFSAAFSYFWIESGLTAVESVREACKVVSFYCDSKFLPTTKNLNSHHFTELATTKKTNDILVYIAGPFFNLAELWLVEEFRNSFQSMGVKVFSPYHDVGISTDIDVAEKDLQGVRECDVLLAIGDNFDSGTVFEAGYAKALNKPVVLYTEYESEDKTLMFIGSGCVICNDFVTTVYRTIWEGIK